VFEQESAGAGAERLVDVFVQVVGGEDDDVAWQFRDDAAGRLEAVHHRHPNVHQHHVRDELTAEHDRLQAVLGLADDDEPALAVQQRDQTGADECLIVGDEDADRPGAGHLSAPEFS
jgi:hypothetical protein